MKNIDFNDCARFETLCALADRIEEALHNPAIRESEEYWLQPRGNHCVGCALGMAVVRGSSLQEMEKALPFDAMPNPRELLGRFPDKLLDRVDQAHRAGHSAQDIVRKLRLSYSIHFKGMAIPIPRPQIKHHV